MDELVKERASYHHRTGGNSKLRIVTEGGGIMVEARCAVLVAIVQ